eukprot:422229-Rhodomonas_salina.4
MIAQHAHAMRDIISFVYVVDFVQDAPAQIAAEHTTEDGIAQNAPAHFRAQDTSASHHRGKRENQHRIIKEIPPKHPGDVLVTKHTQLRVISTDQHTSKPAHQHTSTPTDQHTNTPTSQQTSTAAQQHINRATEQQTHATYAI